MWEKTDFSSLEFSATHREFLPTFWPNGKNNPRRSVCWNLFSHKSLGENQFSNFLAKIFFTFREIFLSWEIFVAGFCSTFKLICHKTSIDTRRFDLHVLAPLFQITANFNSKIFSQNVETNGKRLFTGQKYFQNWVLIARPENKPTHCRFARVGSLQFCFSVSKPIACIGLSLCFVKNILEHHKCSADCGWNISAVNPHHQRVNHF